MSKYVISSIEFSSSVGFKDFKHIAVRYYSLRVIFLPFQSCRVCSILGENKRLICFYRCKVCSVHSPRRCIKLIKYKLFNLLCVEKETSVEFSAFNSNNT